MDEPKVEAKRKRRPKYCPRCKKNLSLKLHACPYDEDINDDPTPKCYCCEDCQELCADEI